MAIPRAGAASRTLRSCGTPSDELDRDTGSRRFPAGPGRSEDSARHSRQQPSLPLRARWPLPTLPALPGRNRTRPRGARVRSGILVSCRRFAGYNLVRWQQHVILRGEARRLRRIEQCSPADSEETKEKTRPRDWSFQARAVGRRRQRWGPRQQRARNPCSNPHRNFLRPGPPSKSFPPPIARTGQLELSLGELRCLVLFPFFSFLFCFFSFLFLIASRY